MFTEERQSIIIKQIKETGRVEVTDLAENLEVSVDTIRRDLKSLEDKGLLRRTHGGAIPMKMSGPQTQLKERTSVNAVSKNLIARKAASLIEEGDSLLLDGSSSVLALVPYLSYIPNLIIYTGSPSIACAVLETHRDTRLEMIGGCLRRDADNTTGCEAVDCIRRLHTDKVFMGVCGLNREGHLSSFNPDEASIHKEMLNAGRKVILLMDASKWEQTYLQDLGPLPDNCLIISDDELPLEMESIIDKKIKHGVEVLRVQH